MAFIAKQRYKLDIAPMGGWVIVYASQHDDGAREIEFEITNQGRTFSIPASINVSVQGIKLNGSYFSHSCSYSGNIVTMALADDMTDIIGKSICVLKFTNSSQQKLATAKFVLNVDTDSSSEGIIIDTEAEEIFNQMLNDIRAQAASISADIAELQSMVGSPLVASIASAMTDHNKIYVYVGSESGYTNGNWYYWNGSAWTSGGVYNSVAVETDKTLSVENMPADSNVVGNSLKHLNCADILIKRTNTATSNGITFSYSNGMYTVEGTATGWAFYNLTVDAGRVIPDGGRYYANVLVTTGIRVEVWASVSGTLIRIATFTESGFYELSIPDETVFFYLRFGVLNGTSISNGVANAWVTRTATTEYLYNIVNNIINQISEIEVEIENSETIIKNLKNLKNLNCTNILNKRIDSITSNGISYTYDTQKDSYKIIGTATGISFYNLTINADMVVPDRKKYYVEAILSEGVVLECWRYKSDGTSVQKLLTITDSGSHELSIPDDTPKFWLRFAVDNGVMVDGYANAYLSTAYSNHGLTEKVNNAAPSVINNYTFNNYDATYNVTATPEITTDTNSYLAPSGDTTDRTADIITMLTQTGCCRLGKGEYYVSNLIMPEKTALIGCGNESVIVLVGTSAGFTVKPSSHCVIDNVCITGKLPFTEGIAISETLGNRDGILFEGNWTQAQTATTQPFNVKISNVTITNFTGSGIKCYDTGQGTANILEVCNVWIRRCSAGINIEYESEFHKFTNVRTYLCYYGCINNGGNNVFVNCDFSECTLCLLMDNQESQSPNNSHGSMVGCVFNHAGKNAGINGIGIKILNCDNGFIFTGCQIFYSQIEINDSNGIVFSSCNFGASNCDITINNGGVILFSGNMHQATPIVSIINNNNVHFVNCYNRATGDAIVA